MERFLKFGCCGVKAFLFKASVLLYALAVIYIGCFSLSTGASEMPSSIAMLCLSICAFVTFPRDQRTWKKLCICGFAVACVVLVNALLAPHLK